MRHLSLCVVFIFSCVITAGGRVAQAAKVFTPQVTPVSLGFSVPSPEPTLPGGVDIYNPPYIATVTTGPQIAQMLRTAGADQTFTLSGDKFLQGTTRFDMFSQTTDSNWNLRSVRPSFASLQTASVTVPANFPTWSMYLVWPNNEGVRGKPFALNRTEGWWVGPKAVAVGSTVSIYGRNLAKNNGTSVSYVYIKPTGAAGDFVIPTSVNPYKVDITVPSLSAGTYEVWIHNGHGGHFGWSGPLALTVLSQDPWANLGTTTYNVTSYGAVGDGVTDDGAAVEAALADAGTNAPATVYFPAGTYGIKRTLFIPSHVRILGAGRDTTKIKLTVPLSTISGPGFIQHSGEGHLIESIEINADEMLDAWPNAMMYLSPYDFKVLNARLSSKGANTMEFEGGSRNLVFQNTDIIGMGSFFGASEQIFVNNSTFHMTNDGEYGVGVWGGQEISVTDNHFYNLNEAVADGHGIGRIFVSQGHFGSTQNMYFGGNETHNFAPRDCTMVDCNKGEQILFEFGGNEYQAGATAVSANTVTFDSVATDPSIYPGGQHIMIVSGKGLGQQRKIVSVVAGVVTVDADWDVTPDTSTSQFMISSIAQHAAVFDNTFQGRDTHSDHDSASTAVNVFGNSFDIVIDNNDISKMRHGLMVVTHTSSEGSYANPLYFTLTANNHISDSFHGIYSGHVYGYDSVDTFGAIGNVFRNNTITNINHAGIIVDQWDARGGHVDSQVFERNQLSNLPYGLIAGLKVIWETDGSFDPAPFNGTHLTGMILRKNSFDRGTAAITGSVGFRSEPFNTWLNQQSTWTGFESGNPWRVTTPKK